MPKRLVTYGVPLKQYAKISSSVQAFPLLGVLHQRTYNPYHASDG